MVTLIDILKAALELEIIDIFTCISYQSRGTLDDEIIRDLTKRIEAKRAVL